MRINFLSIILVNYLGYFDPRISFCPYFLQVKLSSGGISVFPILGAATVSFHFLISSFLRIPNELGLGLNLFSYLPNISDTCYSQNIYTGKIYITNFPFQILPPGIKTNKNHCG